MKGSNHGAMVMYVYNMLLCAFEGTNSTFYRIGTIFTSTTSTTIQGDPEHGADRSGRVVSQQQTRTKDGGRAVRTYTRTRSHTDTRHTD
eukprot:1070825-Prymnesium_polylepis.1